MYIDVSFPRPSSRPRLGILVHWLLIDSVLLTEPLHYSKTVNNSTLQWMRRGLLGGQVATRSLQPGRPDPADRPTDPDAGTVLLRTDKNPIRLRKDNPFRLILSYASCEERPRLRLGYESR